MDKETEVLTISLPRNQARALVALAGFGAASVTNDKLRERVMFGLALEAFMILTREESDNVLKVVADFGTLIGPAPRE